MEEGLILVVEDDDVIGAGLVRALAASGYDVERVATGTSAIERSRTLPRIDLVLLDLGLPDVDGIEVCRTIRRDDSAVPIIVLTARREEIDVVLGLDAGAVDYITKPFRLAELLARVRAQLRRPAPDSTIRLTNSMSVGDVRIDVQARRVWVHDEEVMLRAKEFDLLAFLVANAGRVVTRERLMSEVWDEHWFGSTKTLDVHIAALRRRLGEDAGDTANEPSRIATLRSVGYRYELPVP